MLGPDTCKACGKTLQPGLSNYCKQSCIDEAKRRRDRDRKRGQRGVKRGRIDPGEFFERDPASKLPDIQPRAFQLVQARAVEFVKWLGHDLAEDAARFCFMRGYSELDRVEILKALRGEIKIAPEEIPPDPPAEPEVELYDVFAD